LCYRNVVTAIYYSKDGGVRESALNLELSARGRYPNRKTGGVGWSSITEVKAI
jgi:hypothetical protein